MLHGSLTKHCKMTPLYQSGAGDNAAAPVRRRDNPWQGVAKRMIWIIRATVAASILLWASAIASAELYINEVFFNPGGAGDDLLDEYIELRGTPSMSLANHYLIFVENEGLPDGTGAAGEIDNVFNLGAFSIGSNGFLTIRQKGNRYGAPAAGTANLVNTSNGPDSGGYGSGPLSSTVGAEDSPAGMDPPFLGHVEGGGFTAMLIRANPWGPDLMNSPVVPTIAPIFDLDTDNDGLDQIASSHMNWRDSWTIIDSIGIHGEDSETQYGRLYGQVNFGAAFGFVPPGWQPNIEAGSEFQLLNYEVEYIGRWGNSTGHTLDDWHISNLTDNAGSGSLGVFAAGGPDWRQSCISGVGCHAPNDGNPNTPAPQPPGGTESNKAVPYGTKLTQTLGAPNYITGDFNKDGYVDAADYVVWRKTVGQSGAESNHPAADANHDFVVNMADFNLWRANFGAPHVISGGAGSSASYSSVTIPEPATLLLALLAGAALPLRRSAC
jgi:hypothetical protein